MTSTKLAPLSAWRLKMLNQHSIWLSHEVSVGVKAECAFHEFLSTSRHSWCARQKGYPLVVTMAEQFSVERRRLMRFLGAKVVLTPAGRRAVWRW